MIHPNPVATKTRSGDSANVPWWNGDELDRVNGMGGRNRATKRCASQAAAEARETRGECPEQYEAGALEEPEQGKNDFRGGVVLETRTNGGPNAAGETMGSARGKHGGRNNAHASKIGHWGPKAVVLASILEKRHEHTSGKGSYKHNCTMKGNRRPRPWVIKSAACEKRCRPVCVGGTGCASGREGNVGRQPRKSPTASTRAPS